MDQPDRDAIQVSLERLRKCPEEVADGFWPPDKVKSRAKTTRKKTTQAQEGLSNTVGKDALGTQ